jgi:hypothetical protein
MKNKEGSTSGKIFYVCANLLIKDSCILGNYEKSRIFYVTSSGKVTLSNCTIDDDIFTNGRYTGSVTVIKTITKTFINALSHISTQLCDSYFDSYGTLTVEPTLPSQSPRYLMSCNCKRLTIDLINSMQFIFLLTFLPSDPANDDYYF